MISKTIIDTVQYDETNQELVTSEQARLSTGQGLDQAHLLHLYKLCDRLEFSYEFGRGTHWLGEEGLNYKYANKNHIAQGWHSYSIEDLTESMRLLSIEYGFASPGDDLYNHLLINQYLPKQRLNMHRDDEPQLTGPIASLSLGASSVFTYGVTRSVGAGKKVTLKHGDLMLGSREFFNEYYHSVAPIKYSDKLQYPTRQPLYPVRYNLTWRTIRSDS